MVVTHAVTVFGFGSYFSDDRPAEDIDLLVVHNDLTAESCAFAIRCKHLLSRLICRSHITMLSVCEEESFGFIDTAQAMRLGAIRADHIDDDAAALCHRVLSFPEVGS